MKALSRLCGWLARLVNGTETSLPTKGEIVLAVRDVIPEFVHVETNRLLDHRL